MTRLAALLLIVATTSSVSAQPPAVPNKVDTPTVNVLTGLTVPEFEREMQQFVQSLGVNCGGCHVGRGNFAIDENPRKLVARQMIELTKALNKQCFPNYTPAEGESRLGRVTCYTCHQGDLKRRTVP